MDDRRVANKFVSQKEAQYFPLVLYVSSFFPAVPFLHKKILGRGVKVEERRAFECHENSGFPLSASCLACHQLGELCLAFFRNFFFLLMYSVSDFLSARIVSPSCRDENEELIIVWWYVVVVVQCLFKLFIPAFFGSSSLPPLKSLLSSFRERLPNVLPTRCPLPLLPYATM